MSAPQMHDPVAVNTQDGSCWVRRAQTREGRGLYALEGTAADAPELVLATLKELAEHGLRSMAFALPVPGGNGPHPSESAYPAALPWAALLDDEDLAEFLDELAASAVTYDGATALAEVEKTCGTWRLIAEAQHAHNTAPGPDAMTRTFAPTQGVAGPSAEWFAEAFSPKPVEGEHYAAVHHTYRVPRDLPETGGAR